MQDATINWLRGDRSLEAGNGTGYLRARISIMGDVVNSGPVYKKARELYFAYALAGKKA